MNDSNVITTVTIAIIAVLGIFIFREENSISSIAYAFSLTLLASSIFYFITVNLPEKKRRDRIRKGLKNQYRSFKKRCIDCFLIASNSQEYNDRDNLLDPQEFRRYFLDRSGNDQTRWDLITMSIDDQNYIFDEIVREFEFLDREIAFARLSVDIDDEIAEQFLIRFRQIIHTIKAATKNSDDYKYFSRTLYAFFTSSEGQSEEDFFESMIEKI